jgi:hypothetical protein
MPNWQIHASFIEAKTMPPPGAKRMSNAGLSLCQRACTRLNAELTVKPIVVATDFLTEPRRPPVWGAQRRGRNRVASSRRNIH